MHAQLVVAVLPFRFPFAAYRFLSGTLVANKSCRRRPELMSSRRPVLIHRRLLVVYVVDLPDNRICRVKCKIFEQIRIFLQIDTENVSI